MIVSENSMLFGFSGRDGEYIYYQRNGKTIRARFRENNYAPTPRRKQRQRLFSEAIDFAKNVMSIPELKTEYVKKAKKWKMENGFLAAVSEYMKLGVG
jgi:hypothetical protein